jgi:hypothetical protein
MIVCVYSVPSQTRPAVTQPGMLRIASQEKRMLCVCLISTSRTYVSCDFFVRTNVSLHDHHDWLEGSNAVSTRSVTSVERLRYPSMGLYVDSSYPPKTCGLSTTREGSKESSVASDLIPGERAKTSILCGTAVGNQARTSWGIGCSKF